MKATLGLIFMLFSLTLFGQNENPYKEFGYDAQIMPDNIRALVDPKFKITNTDTASTIGMLLIDISKRKATFFDKKGVFIYEDSLDRHSVSRWLTVDPKRQFSSPYVGMGNNPISKIDPDGAYSWGGALWRNAFYGGGGIYKSGGEWGYNKSGSTFTEVNGIKFRDMQSFFGPTRSSGMLSNAWNSPLARAYVPDYFVVGIGAEGAFGGYGGQELNFTLLLRGQEPGLYVNETTSFGIVTSGGLDAVGNVGMGWFAAKDPRNVPVSVLGGTQVSAALGAEAKWGVGGGAGGAIDFGLKDNYKGISTVTLKVYGSVGVGFASPVHGSVGGGVSGDPIPLVKF